MKIDWKKKETKITAIILAVVIIPIMWNQGKTIVMSVLTNYMMNQPKVVQVSKPIMKDIQPKFDTTGRIEANLSVDIVARVSGWLQKKYFEEGDRVTKGQKLFLIEPDEYILASQNARATVNENSAVYKNSQIDLQRAEQLLKDDLVSREYYDNALTQRNRNRAALDGAIAQMKQANLNLSYTNITSPMNGRIGKVNISVGNYVTPSSGAIAQIYSTNPMKVIFPLNSGDFIELKKYYKAASEEDRNDENAVSVLLGLADGTQYEIEGKIEFVDNKIDESTGTVTLRAIFENPDELLVPGDYVKVTIRINKPYKVMMIPQSATKTDVGTGYYVWVVKDGKAVKKDIKVNQNIDNNWIVESGLDENDEVVDHAIKDGVQNSQVVGIVRYGLPISAGVLFLLLTYNLIKKTNS